MKGVMNRPRTSIVLFLALAAGQTVFGQTPGVDSNVQPRVLNDVGITQRVGVQIPRDLAFKDEEGRTVTLDTYLGKRPIILSLVYYECPMLCTEVLNGIVRTIAPLSFDLGKDFDIVTVSINPQETPELAAQKKALYLERYGRAGGEQGWHFLTGTESSIKTLADSVGFKFAYDSVNEQYSHGSTIIVLTSDGQVAQYYFGLEYPTKEVRLSLVEASKNKLGTVYDQVLLYCFHYDPEQGKYGLVIMKVIRLAGAVTLVAMGSFMFVMFRRDRRTKDRSLPPSESV